jgi:hypothetical protein
MSLIGQEHTAAQSDIELIWWQQDFGGQRVHRESDGRPIRWSTRLVRSSLQLPATICLCDVCQIRRVNLLATDNSI